VTTTHAHRDLLYYLHRAALLSERVGERRFHAHVGIGRAAYLVLRAVEDAGDAGARSQQSIADHLSLTKGAVSRHVAAARRNGWLTIEDSPVSRREKTLALTARGRDLTARGRTVQREYEELCDRRLDAADTAAAVRTLKAVCESLEREDRP
jgi:DNA-binding MarR family transcriptional regulator